MTGVTLKPSATELQRLVRNGQPAFLTDLDWPSFQKLVGGLGPRRPRFTYDHGNLEIMPTSSMHEIFRWLLEHLLMAWAEETGVALCAGGQMSFERADLERAMQPDECYWVQHAALMRGRVSFDLSQVPSPDLVIEVEVSNTVLDRLAILAALKVPEVWRFDGTTLHVGRLQANGQYQWGVPSAAFPTLPLAELVRYLHMVQTTTDHLNIVRTFRAWVRAQFG